MKYQALFSAADVTGAWRVKGIAVYLVYSQLLLSQTARAPVA